MPLAHIRNSFEAIKRELARNPKFLPDSRLVVGQGTAVISRSDTALITAQATSKRPMWVVDVGRLIARLPTSG